MFYNFCVHEFYYLPPTNTRQVADMPFKYRILSKHLYALTRVALKVSSHCKSSYLRFIDEEPGEALVSGCKAMAAVLVSEFIKTAAAAHSYHPLPHLGLLWLLFGIWPWLS